MKKIHPDSPENIRNNETFDTEETFTVTLNFENSPINSTLNQTVKIDDFSSSFWLDQKQVQQDSKNLKSVIQKLPLPVKISIFSKVVPKHTARILAHTT